MKIKKLMSMLIVTVTLLCLFNTTAFAAVKSDESKRSQVLGNYVTFKNLDKIQKQTFEGKDKNGYAFTITIVSDNITNDSLISTNSTIGPIPAKSYEVYYNGVIVNCSFHMTVYDNKITQIYNPNILTIGGNYSNQIFNTRDSNRQAILSFDYSSYGNLVGKSCWLGGFCSGSFNEIEVGYSM